MKNKLPLAYLAAGLFDPLAIHSDNLAFIIRNGKTYVRIWLIEETKRKNQGWTCKQRHPGPVFSSRETVLFYANFRNSKLHFL